LTEEEIQKFVLRNIEGAAFRGEQQRLLNLEYGSHQPFLYPPWSGKLGITGRGSETALDQLFSPPRFKKPIEGKSTGSQAWEYHIDRGRLDEARLAELGAKGWELASVVSREDTELWVFKKPKE
jgi:hypothetical protein